MAQSFEGSVRGRTDASDLDVAAAGGSRFIDRMQQIEDARLASEKAASVARAEQEALGYAMGAKEANEQAEARAASAAKVLADANVHAARIVEDARVEADHVKALAAAVEKDAAERAAAKVKEVDDYAAAKRAEADSVIAAAKANLDAAASDRKAAATERQAVADRNAELDSRQRALDNVASRAAQVIADHKALADKYADAVGG